MTNYCQEALETSVPLKQNRNNLNNFTLNEIILRFLVDQSHVSLKIYS